MEPICAWRGCNLNSEVNKESEVTHGFCANHFKELFDRVRTQVDGALEVASKIYFGRSSHPERRLLEHFEDEEKRCSYLLVVHWAATKQEIEKFEVDIINRYKGTHKRVINDSSDSLGSFSGQWSALYISFSLKQGIGGIPGAAIIKELYRRQRLWPDPILPNSPVLLRCGFKDRADATSELDRFTPGRWHKNKRLNQSPAS